MERRLLLAIVLMVTVAVLPSLFMKPAPRRPAPGAPATGVAPSAPPGTPVAPAPPAPAQPASASPAVGAPRAAPATAIDTASLVSPRSIYRVTSLGGAIEQAVFPAYRTFNGGSRGGVVGLMRPGDRMLLHRLVVGTDTVRLDSAAFSLTRQGDRLQLSGGEGALRLTVEYARAPGQDYLLSVTGQVFGLEGTGAVLLIGLGAGFANVEGDSLDNYRKYGVAMRRTKVENHPFRALKTDTTTVADGPFDWVALKSKYFMGALLSPDSTRPQFAGVLLTGGPRVGRLTTTAHTWVTMPVGPDGRFAYSFYLGPQEYRELHPLGRRLDRASPYGWIFEGIVMPVSTWITQLFIWMHDHLKLGYGLVLVIFGMMVRLSLWPLNQKAMKSQVAMQAVQPLLKEIQDRHKDDPAKLQSEMMKLYKEHKVNPVGGCLPMLLPMPILLALFFVFANTIELRGVSFLWLPDLSQRDPLFIVPVIMGVSMFALSKLGMMGMPPNPQTKMMTIFMPIMMTVLFFNFASGLNLYYAVSNLVSLPQQFLINKARAAEMARRQSGPPAKR